MNHTPEQYSAVEAITSLALFHHSGELTIEAPAGSGKTAVVVEAACKCAAFEEQPRVLTFTRRAAAELRARGCDATTIYALAAEHMPDQDLARVCTEDVARIVEARWAKACNLTPKTASALWPLEGPALLSTNDMLTRLPKEDRCWIVDEAQDCTRPEIEAIRRSARVVAWVGDPWQRIYEWRGAAGMPTGNVRRLTLNHRSDINIVMRAAGISGRPEVTAGATAPNGKTAWLCRSNNDVRNVAEALGCHQVQAVCRRALATMQIEAAACLGLDWAVAYREAPNWAVACDRMRRRLPGVDLSSPRAFLVWQASHDLQDQVADQEVQAMTIHAAKGLQFEHVNLVHWPHKCDEDARLEYVGVTRATHRLVEYRDLAAAIGGER